jgi:hypothetical protein
MAPVQNLGSLRRCARMSLHLSTLLLVCTLAACASPSSSGTDRYTANARQSFTDACIQELRDMGPRRASTYFPFRGHLLSVPEYCIAMARVKIP